MQCAVIAVGRLKEGYWKQALAEYAKRLSAYVKLELVEVADEATPDGPSDAERERVLAAEGERILRHVRDRDAVVVLDIQGKAMTSEQWSARFESLMAGGYGRVVFVVGGSLGVSKEVLQRADVRWSFGPLTLPHQLARVVLLEQLYRGIRIARGEPYHK
nr:23S rRNA (pseudouridine(1915)-N(3))-methyltransferase RlmH [Alicyclobacillus contaminans]